MITDKLADLNTSLFEDWVLMVDFNLIRSAENRNFPSGCMAEMVMFNDLITLKEWIDLPFSGRSFTWSSM